MSRGTAAWLAGSLVAFSLLLTALGLLLLALTSATPVALGWGFRGVTVVYPLTFTPIGALIAVRRPTNPIGWIFCAVGLAGAVQIFAQEYAVYGVIAYPGSLPLAEIMAWIRNWIWIPWIAFGITFLLLLFPDGRLLSPRWRLVVWLAIVTTALPTLARAFVPGPLENFPAVTNPFEIVAIGDSLQVAFAGGLAMAMVSMFLAALSLVLRFRQARGVARQQIKWLAYAAVLLPFAVVLGSILSDYTRLGQAALILSISSIPIAVAIAILRSNLYDIDVIINRTLLYGALTASVVVIYVLIVGLLGTLLQARGNLFIALLATGVVAGLLAPLRDRLQRAINHFMYGERDEPYGVLSRLGQRLEATLAPDAVLPTIVETVKEALKLPYAAIALRQDETFTIVAASGEPVADPLTLPLVYQHETIGQLLLAPRVPGEAFTPADRRLLDDLARQAGVAAHAVRLTVDLQHLTADLQRSRERLITAQEEERRRLRRDLHDGLGPALATQTLKLEAARELLRSHPERADALLSDLMAQSQTALADIRRLVYALRPPALDELGLISALREQAVPYQHTGVAITIEASEPFPPLPAAVEVAVYRIAQEALTNVVRHAHARTCVIRLTLDDALFIEIQDDGCGMLPDQRSGVGLHSMRERAIELGGSWSIEAVPTGGIRVWARLPIGRDGLHTQVQAP